jgi:hypothetical protein
MLYGAEFAVCSQISTKHINTVWGRAYNYCMLNCWCTTQPVGFKRLIHTHTHAWSILHANTLCACACVCVYECMYVCINSRQKKHTTHTKPQPKQQRLRSRCSEQAYGCQSYSNVKEESLRTRIHKCLNSSQQCE